MKTLSPLFYLLLILLSLSVTDSYGQLNIKVTDPNGNGINHARVSSKLNRMQLETDDSGTLRIDKTILGDTFEFRQINFISQFVTLSNSKLTLTIVMQPDTFIFSGFTIKGSPCKQIIAKVPHRYGEEIDKTIRFPSGPPIDYCVKVAQPFELQHNCGTIENISFYVPRFPDFNKELHKIYNLNIYIVVADSANHLAKWQLVHVMDLKKIKTGWNKVKLENCRFNSQKLFVGFELSLKSNEDYEKAIAYSNSREYAIGIASNKNDGHYYWYADFGKRGGKGWLISSGRLVIKIETKEED